jgi:uncharacterized phage protein (predicted DNA packaging)
MLFETLTEFKEQLSFTDALGPVDDGLLTRILGAAEGFVAARLGRALDANTPEAVRHAVLMVAAHWYENREASIDANLRSIPFGVDDIIREYRSWVF